MDDAPEARQAIQILLGLVVALWAVEIIDRTLFDSALQSQGIRPRRLTGLDGILWAPFLHGTFGHLISNTVPFLITAALVMLRGIRRWLAVTAFVAVAAGLLVWLLARDHIHIGISIIIFGYLGYLLIVGFLDNDLLWKAVGVGVFLMYGGSILLGILPFQRGVSWEGHVFGLAAGVGAAFLMRSPD